MIVVAGILLGVAAGFARGGRISRLARLPLSGLWLVLVALLLQWLIFYSPLRESLLNVPPLGPVSATGVLYVVSYLGAVVFMVYNARVLWPVFPGMVLNLTAIAANRGYMPASVSALRRAGRTDATSALSGSADGTLSNVIAMGEGTHLNSLGDWMYVPAWFPMATAFSLGDVLLMLGLAWIIQAGMAGRNRDASVPGVEQTRPGGRADSTRGTGGATV
ncbi:MAG: DUF5317 family protein [Spirochaetia bacterium]